MAREKIRAELLESYKTQQNRTLGELSNEGPVATSSSSVTSAVRSVVKRLTKLQKFAAEIEAKGTQLAFVHLASEDEKARKFFAPYGLEHLPRFADPEGILFQSFGLVRGNWRSYLNYESILRTLIAWLEGHGADCRRAMCSGCLDISHSKRRDLKAFRHKLVSDRPDYLELATPVNSPKRAFPRLPSLLAIHPLALAIADAAR